MTFPIQAAPPSQAALLALDWEPSVWAMYQSLLESDGQAIALNYLSLQQRLDTDPTYNRIVRLGVERLGRATLREIEAALLSLLHPYQPPLSLGALQAELLHYGLTPDYKGLQRLCNRLLTEEQLQRFANPFQSRQFVYCSMLYRAEPAVGDRVMELVRRRSARSGVVECFKLYRPYRQMQPVVRWHSGNLQYGRLTFAHPERLVVLDRPEPFSVQRRA